MPSSDPPSSPPTSSKEAIAYYKTQYEQLEAELAEFQASSRELEAELEKDIEASEKRERKLKEKVESLGYEVEEWKTKYKQSKQEANSVQSTLQKEITALREGNRDLQFKLRDIEVANDDFERQHRHTTSSLEDMESKYNVAIERGVLLEDEVRNGEQERESLRIETQRLRDELSDLKIEADIVQEKLRHAEKATHRRKFAQVDSTPSMPRSPDLAERSSATTASSPTIATPPAKSVSSVTSDAITPPSPPASETACVPKRIGTPILHRPKLSTSTTQRPSFYGGKSTRHTRTPSIPLSNGRSTPSITSRKSLARKDSAHPSGLPRSGSLYQIRGLIGKMQKLEERVQTARSRLPAPVDTPPRTSPRTRSGSALSGQSSIPSSVTMRRSSKKRTSGSNGSYSSSLADGDATPSYTSQSRASFGVPATPSRVNYTDSSRPSSRTSMSSRSSVNPSSSISQARPESRQSLTGTKTPLGHYSTNPTTESRRPRSSMSQHGHNHAVSTVSMDDIDENEPTRNGPTPRKPTLPRMDPARTSIPTPGALKKRTSGSISSIPAPRKFSVGQDRRDSEADRRNAVDEIGETY